MPKKNIVVYYFYPERLIDKKYKIAPLNDLFEELSKMEPEERVLQQKDGNIQLKKIEPDEKKERWQLSFLRNGIDAPFKSKLNDNTSVAEELDDDEYIGSECCIIYDNKSKIIAVQNNRSSVSFNGMANFFNQYFEDAMFLSPITYKKEFCEISDEDLVNYKSLVVGFTDISLFDKIAKKEDNKAISWISQIVRDLSAVNGKFEFGVGRTKKFLLKENLKSLVNCFQENKGVVSTLKVKRADKDSIRLIDLLSNKVYDNIGIVVSKDDPKTFSKILDQMNSVFDDALITNFKNSNKSFEE